MRDGGRHSSDGNKITLMTKLWTRLAVLLWNHWGQWLVKRLTAVGQAEFYSGETCVLIAQCSLNHEQ